MDRKDLSWIRVALEARILGKAPALTVLAMEHGRRLEMGAANLRKVANGYSPIERAADTLDEIAQKGAGVLMAPPHVELGQALESLAKLHREPPTNRFSRRMDERKAERHARRLARSERLRDMAKHGGK